MESLDSYEEIAHDDHNTELREETANLGYWSWVAELSNVPFDFFYMQYEKRVKDNGGSMVLEAHSGATCFFFSFLFLHGRRRLGLSSVWICSNTVFRARRKARTGSGILGCLIWSLLGPRFCFAFLSLDGQGR
jgi:hypothetical protein